MLAVGAIAITGSAALTEAGDTLQAGDPAVTANILHRRRTAAARPTAARRASRPTRGPAAGAAATRERHQAHARSPSALRAGHPASRSRYSVDFAAQGSGVVTAPASAMVTTLTT